MQTFRAIALLCEAPRTPQELADELDIAPRTAYRLLDDLRRIGIEVECTQKGTPHVPAYYAVRPRSVRRLLSL